MKKLDNFVEDIRKVFGSKLKCVFIYGSKANAGLIDSDINLMVVAESVTGEDIRKCSTPVRRWMGGVFDRPKNPMPVFMGEKEWFNSVDVYAMEYSDIKENHKILYGEDLICSLNIKKEDLRLQCESEMKNLLMRFSGSYLLCANDYRAVNKTLIPVIKTINAIFKAVLRLKDIEVSKSHYDNLNKICEIVDIDKNFYEKLLCAKEKHCGFSKKETYAIADEAVVQMDKLLEYINNM